MEISYRPDRPGINKRQIGSRHEKEAGRYLEGLGFEILEYNFRCRSGEIDLIAKEGETLVFVEVKYRSAKGKGFAQEAVGPGKQRSISRVAAFYLAGHRLSLETDCRFDVVAINGEETELIRNAFYYRP